MASNTIDSLNKIFLDNTDINNLGIVRWAKYVFPHYITNDIAQYQKEIYHEILSLYNPLYRNRYERNLELVVFRGGGKSTITNFLIPCYMIMYNGHTFKIKIDNEIVECKIDEGLIVIVSKTFTSAQEFTQRIRDEFTTNKILKVMNKGKVEEALDDITGEWTKAAFKINGIYVLAVGTGQQIRGKVKGASRPTTIIFDDIYSEENIKTAESRQNIRYWFYNAAMNTIDDIKGKAIVVGTIVHEDTIITDLEKNTQWKTIKYPLMQLEKFDKFITNYLDYDIDSNIYKLKFNDIKDQKERIKKQREYYDNIQSELFQDLSWADRIDLYSIALKVQEASMNQMLSSIYQEYFHITISESDKVFKKEYFQYIDAKFRIINNNTFVDIEDKTYPINIEFGVDLAAGLQTSDDTCITIVGKLPDERIIIFNTIFGKFGIRDVLRDETANRYKKIETNIDNILKRGYVDEIIRQIYKWRPSKVKIGIAGQEIAIINEMRRIFTENKIYIPIYTYTQTAKQGTKEDRIKDILLQYYQTKMIYHNMPLEKLEYQLEWLGKVKNDDVADATANAILNLGVPYHIYIDTSKEEDIYIPRFTKDIWRLN